MIYLRFADENCAPTYMTFASAGADLKARTEGAIGPGKVGKVSTGTWITNVDWSKVPDSFIPELQIRARSSLAWKYQVCLANGIGTVDADYPDEICVLLHNHGSKEFIYRPGDRIAQLVMNLAVRIPEVKIIDQTRSGGFGSTGK